MNLLSDLPLGQALRDEALAKHRANHSADIHNVRIALLVAAELRGLTELTGDDASVVADQLGLPEGERRWLGAVFRGWDRVQATDRMVPSRLARRNARRVMVWRLLPTEGV